MKRKADWQEHPRHDGPPYDPGPGSAPGVWHNPAGFGGGNHGEQLIAAHYGGGATRPWPQPLLPPPAWPGTPMPMVVPQAAPAQAGCWGQHMPAKQPRLSPAHGGLQRTVSAPPGLPLPSPAPPRTPCTSPMDAALQYAQHRHTAGHSAHTVVTPPQPMLLARQNSGVPGQGYSHGTPHQTPVHALHWSQHRGYGLPWQGALPETTPSPQHPLSAARPVWPPQHCWSAPHAATVAPNGAWAPQNTRRMFGNELTNRCGSNTPAARRGNYGLASLMPHLDCIFVTCLGFRRIGSLLSPMV